MKNWSADKSTYRKQLLTWYQAHKRRLPWRETVDPYRIWISEVMLQQTQVQTVIGYYLRFLERFPDIVTLAEADLSEVIKFWEGLGYYSRARHLHKAAQIVCREYQGKIPDHPDRFKKLPGVGDYIAAAVDSIAFGNPAAVVDGNVKRVLARLFRMEIPVNQPSGKKKFQQLADSLLDNRNPGDYNQAVMELGALICTPSNPDCRSCPVSGRCQAHIDGLESEYPRRLAGKPTPTYDIAVGIVLKQKRFLITLRKAEGLLGGLWEFPGGKIEDTESPEDACIREIKEETGLAVQVIQALPPVKHAYTHFKINMKPFLCRFLSGKVKLNGPVDHCWITEKQIRDYAFPKANHKIFPELRNHLKDLI